MTEEVPVERKPITEFPYSHRLLSWYREKTLGVPMAGFYDQMPLTENRIVIPDNMTEELESAVIEHEKAHHEQAENPEFYWTTKLIYVGVAGLLSGMYFQSELLTAISGSLVLTMPFVEIFYVREKEANESVDWDSVEESLDLKSRSRIAKYFEYILYAVLILPGNVEHLLKSIYREVRETIYGIHRTTEEGDF